MRAFFFLPLLLFGQLSFLTKGGGPVKQVQIFGEMHSGTNYLEMLLVHNISGVRVFSGLQPSKRPFSQKHFPAWFTKPLSYHKRLRLDARYWTLEGSDKTLFVVIVRDPYDWIRSLFGRPFHIVQRENFGAFIRQPVEIVVSRDRVNTIDFNPETGKPFANPLVWRSAKLRNILALPERVKMCYFINYEVLKREPEKVICEMAARFGMERKGPFVPVTTYKRSSEKFVEKQYFPLSKKDLSYMNEILDWNIEERVGYSKKES